MKHVEKHHSDYSPGQLFDLVAAVERYPTFLPWIVAAKVFRRSDKTIWTHLTMGTTLLNKRFTTVAVLDSPHRIAISSHDPIFEHFQQIWTFNSAKQGGTDIQYQVDLQFSSRILQTLIGAMFAEQTRAMVKAYEREARRLYGIPR